MKSHSSGARARFPLGRVSLAIAATAVVIGAWVVASFGLREPMGPKKPWLKYEPHRAIETSGFSAVLANMPRWDPLDLEAIAAAWDDVGHRLMKRFDPGPDPPTGHRGVLPRYIAMAMLHLYEGESAKAYEVLAKARDYAESDDEMSRATLYTIIYFQGIAALRMGEDDNCIACRGESSCIVPISRAAIHRFPKGSELAIRHFTEYLLRFPDCLEVRWLLTVAHMTLGGYPSKIDSRYRLPLERFEQSAFDIGRFRDVSQLVGLDRFSQAGGAILEDFDNDNLLDVFETAVDPTESVQFRRNAGDGRFVDLSQQAGLARQLGGLYCVQTDYDNDGYKDVFVVRGAWWPYPIRPSLLHNEGDGRFTDVTELAGLLLPLNAISASWADYDNDGFVDLFIPSEVRPNRLFRNNGDGTFRDVAGEVGLAGDGSVAKGAAWLDHDNDGDPDLFVNHLSGLARFYRNDGGRFTDCSETLGIQGPKHGFSCWAFDYNNDGWLDIWATSYDRSYDDVVRGLIGEPHGSSSNALFRNNGGNGFIDETKSAGLDSVFLTMGSNFADFDNDGFLDFYLGTGDPSLGSIYPNRMFKNVAGTRFAEISASSGTASIQKGHGVACGDWDRDGDVDLFIEMGGAVDGDKYDDILFQNPGQGNHSLTVKLRGVKTNRAAIGARIKVVTDGSAPLTIHRHISSGSSFGANPFEQTIGLGKSTRVATLEVEWPTSGTRQIFRDIEEGQLIEIEEFSDHYMRIPIVSLPQP
jgi:hypothetical protein